jgi:hypothetical protein
MEEVMKNGHYEVAQYLNENGLKINKPVYQTKNYKLCERYISFCHKMKIRAQKRIYFWWIPICYDVNREIGKRMMLKNLEKARELGMEFK